MRTRGRPVKRLDNPSEEIRRRVSAVDSLDEKWLSGVDARSEKIVDMVERHRCGCKRVMAHQFCKVHGKY